MVVSSGLTPYHFISVVGVQVRVFTPGVVVKLGMISSFGGPDVYIGLYHDSGGFPAERLTASTQSYALPGTVKADLPQPVEIPVPEWSIDSVVDSVNGDPYWILVETDATIGLQVSPSAMTGWYMYPEPSFGGLPDTAPTAAMLETYPTPALYIVLAQ